MFKKTLLFLMVVISVVFFLNVRKGGNTGVLYGDAFGYYAYLPSAFIYHNLDSMNVLPEDKDIDQYVYGYFSAQEQIWTTPNGRFLNQYTFGTALMEAPFFFIGHILAKLTWQPETGYSIPYQNAIRLSSIVYGLLGLLLVYKILRKYFDERVSLLTVATLFLGGNLFWFMLYQAGMSHIPTFFLFSLLVWSTIRLFEDPKWKWFLIVGFCCSLITFIRPVNIVCILVPLLFGISSWRGLVDRFRFFLKYYFRILVVVFICLLPWIIQLAYWKSLSGSFFYDSYGSQQTFDFLHPQIKKGLIGANNGWFFYSPALLLFLPGLLFLKRIPGTLTLILSFFPVYWYLIYSWFAYYYPNGFGSRPMVDVNALVALPVAAVLSVVFERGRWLKISTMAFIGVCALMSFSFMLQKHLDILDTNYANSRFVRQMLFKLKLNYDDLVTYDFGGRQPDTTKIFPATQRVYFTFPDTAYLKRDSLSDWVYEYTPEHPVRPAEAFIVYHDNPLKPAKWVRGVGMFFSPDWPDIWNTENFVYTLQGKDGRKKWVAIRINNKIGRFDEDLRHQQLYQYQVNQWGLVSFYIKLPKYISDGDTIRVQIPDNGNNSLKMKNVWMQLYGEK